MKGALLVFMLALLFGTLNAQDKTRTIITTDQQIYKKAIVTDVAPNAISINYEGGAAKIPFAKLSADLQKELGYDPIKAALYEEQQKIAEGLRIKAQLEAWDRFRAEQSRAQPPPAAEPSQ